MILKKPFAFLIKYFKIIHIILLAIIIYVTHKFNNLVTFFGKYSVTQIANENIIKSHMSILIFICIIIIITISTLVWYLMYKKQKPSNFYLFCGVYYFIILVAMLYAYSTIQALATASVTQQTARALRDIYLILLFPNFYFIIMTFIRGIGFDIKKFNFNKDLEELEIKSEDNEEFEFVLGSDSYKLQRKTRRTFREFSYYIKENKFFITIIVSTIALIVLITTILNSKIFEHTYKIGETLKTSEINYTLNNAYVTSYDFGGKKIKDDKIFIILDFSLSSNGQVTKIRPENFYIKYGKKSYSYSTIYLNSFSDLGVIYKGTNITNTQTNYIFVFELDNNVNTNKIALNIFDKVEYKNDVETYSFKQFKIKPINLDSRDERNESINSEIKLNNTVFGNTKLVIKSVKINSSYSFDKKSCNEKNICTITKEHVFPQSSNYDLASIEYELDIDKNSIAGKNASDPISFFNKFIKFGMFKDDKEKVYNTVAQDKGLENTIFVDVPKTLNNYSNISVVIATRTDYIRIPISK